MGSSISKVRKSQRNKVLPETPTLKDNVTCDLEIYESPDGETLPPLRLAPSTQTVLPAIIAKTENINTFDESPNWSKHLKEDDDDEFQNALDADLQLNLDQERSHKDDENVRFKFGNVNRF